MSALGIIREGADVVVRIDGGHGVGTFPFRFHCGSEWAAELLKDRLREVLERRMRFCRAEAYAEGWKEAKAKVAKTTEFFGWLP